MTQVFGYKQIYTVHDIPYSKFTILPEIRYYHISCTIHDFTENSRLLQFANSRFYSEFAILIDNRQFSSKIVNLEFGIS